MLQGKKRILSLHIYVCGIKLEQTNNKGMPQSIIIQFNSVQFSRTWTQSGSIPLKFPIE